MSQLLLVDFDGTLFKSDEFHNDIFLYLNSTYKIPLEDIKEAYEGAKKDGKPHSLKKQFKILGLKNISGLIEEIKHYLISLEKNYLYSDTLDFINKHKKNIIVFTYADPFHYKYKLKISGLNKYRLPVIIVDSDKNEFLKSNLKTSLIKTLKRTKETEYSQYCWIDDKIDGFKKPITNIDYIRIKRLGDKYSHLETPNNVREIESLLSLF